MLALQALPLVGVGFGHTALRGLGALLHLRDQLAQTVAFGGGRGGFRSRSGQFVQALFEFRLLR